MPIYEYLCKSCGEKTEKIQSLPLEQITCPACGLKAGRIVSMTSTGGDETSAGCSMPIGSGFG